MTHHENAFINQLIWASMLCKIKGVENEHIEAMTHLFEGMLRYAKETPKNLIYCISLISLPIFL